jgi:hypothetical protein
LARINFEDNVESQEPFWALLAVLGGDRDRALGKLIRFFRLAQKAYGYDQPMTQEELAQLGFQDMIDAGWAVPVEGGFQAFGAKKHFAWYRQKIESGIKGGETTRNKHKSGGAIAPALPGRVDVPPSPLSLAPSPALALSKNKENTPPPTAGGVQGLTECIGEHEATLKHFGISKTALLADHGSIARAIQRFGFERVRAALVGARFEEKTERFNPAKHYSLARILDHRKLEKFENLGFQAQPKKTEDDWNSEKWKEIRRAAGEKIDD